VSNGNADGLRQIGTTGNLRMASMHWPIVLRMFPQAISAFARASTRPQG